MTGLPLDAGLVELTLAPDGNQRAWLCQVVQRPQVVPGPDAEALVTLQALGHKRPHESDFHAGADGALLYRSGGTLWRQPCVVRDARGFPLLKTRLEGAPLAVRRESLVEVETTFPVGFQVLGRDNIDSLGRLFRERLQSQTGWGAEGGAASSPGGVLDNQAELAIFALAKAMVRLDGRFDQLLQKLHRSRKRVVSGAKREESNPHEVLVFSLAKMMVTLLDDKFDRLLAALRDPDVLARWGKKRSEEVGEHAPGVSHEVMVVQSLSCFMDTMSEKFERIVRLLSGRGLQGVALEQAWAVAVGGDMLTLRLARPLAIESTLDLELKLPLFPPLPLLAFGRVLECDEVAADEPEARYRARVELAGLDWEDRELLIQFVFRKQREILRARKELKP